MKDHAEEQREMAESNKKLADEQKEMVRSAKELVSTVTLNTTKLMEKCIERMDQSRHPTPRPPAVLTPAPERREQQQSRAIPGNTDGEALQVRQQMADVQRRSVFRPVQPAAISVAADALCVAPAAGSVREAAVEDNSTEVRTMPEPGLVVHQPVARREVPPLQPEVVIELSAARGRRDDGNYGGQIGCCSE